MSGLDERSKRQLGTLKAQVRCPSAWLMCALTCSCAWPVLDGARRVWEMDAEGEGALAEAS